VAGTGGVTPTVADLRQSTELSKVCDQYEDAIPKMTSVTIAVIDRYHEVLGKLAKGDNWTLEDDIKGFSDELAKLKAKDGDKVIKANDIETYTAAVNFIAKAIVDVIREREAKKLLEKELPWADVLRPLRTWYGDQAALVRLAPALHMHGDALVCKFLKETWLASGVRATTYMRCDSKRCAPLRAAEMVIESEERAGKFDKCELQKDGSQPERSKAALAVIDAWFKANEELRREAFKPDAAMFEAALKNLETQRDRFKKAF